MPSSWRSRLLLGLLVVAAAIGLFFAMRSMSSGSTPDEVASQTPEPSPSESATPAESEPAVAQPKPFRVEILSAKGEEVDSTNMFGRDPDRRPAVIKRAAGKAALTLQRYLNAEFVDPESRFTRGPLALLLTDNARQALGDRARRALGVGGPKIEGGTTISAKARAIVVYDGNRPFAVTLRYSAKMSLVQNGRPARLTQTGTMVMRQLHNGAWRADLVDVQLSLPERDRAVEDRGAKEEPASGEASEEATS